MKSDLLSALAIGGFVTLFIGAFGGVFVLIGVLNDGEKRARAKLRTTGVRGDALIRSFRAISMTQHRVVLELSLPTGRFGRELVLSGLTSDWLAHHAGLALRVPVIADPGGTQVWFEGVAEGPPPTVGHTVRFVLQCLAGLLVAFAIVSACFFGLARSRRASADAAIDADVRRLRGAFDAAGLGVDGLTDLTPRIRSQDLVQRVSFQFDAGERCNVDVFRTVPTRSPTMSGPPALENGKLSLRCDPSHGGNVPRIQAVFAAFR